MVAGREVTPADHAATERLRRYWMERIPFGAPGSYTTCVTLVGKHLPPEQVHGYCARLYHEATGRWPGDHDQHR